MLDAIDPWFIENESAREWRDRCEFGSSSCVALSSIANSERSTSNLYSSRRWWAKKYAPVHPRTSR
jgi:hypothetical protein